MTVRVGINGFGRIGRLFLRLALLRKEIEVVAINDLVPADNLAYLFKFDTVHGTFRGEVKSTDDRLIIDGHEIHVLAEKEPNKIPWKSYGVDIVIESTGKFTLPDDAKKHLEAGAKRVVVTAPAKGEMPTFVMGINEAEYAPEKDKIVSCASCTTTCLATITKVLLENFGIEEGLMTTVHAMTAVQPSVDGSSKKDWRGGRAAAHNIIPSSTGAAKAVGLCLPQVKGKLTGMAFRVPVIDVSVVDLTVRLSKKTSYEEICSKMKEASTGSLKGYLAYTDEEVVSSDYLGTTYSAIFDEKAGIALNDQFFKLVAWYDNEMGYTSRVVDFIVYMAQKKN